jgi:hypothetical protein
MILESELLPCILDCETDFGTICINDGFGGAQEWSA